MKFQNEETQSSEAVCPLDCCVLVFSYLSCLTGSVSVIFKCLCDCDTLCLRPPLELRGQASKVNASSHHKDQHQQPDRVKCPYRSLSQTRIRVTPSVTNFWPPFYSKVQPQTAGLVLDTCTRPSSVSSCCVLLVSMVLSNFMIGIDN